MGRRKQIAWVVVFGLASAASLLAGCFNPTIHNDGFACYPTQIPACPEGFFCIGGLCHDSKTGGGGGGNGNVGDMALAGGSQDLSGGGSSLDLSHPSSAADLAMSGGSCAHSLCATGTKLASGCDPCVTKICSQDSYCCVTKWSAQCVQEVASIL